MLMTELHILQSFPVSCLNRDDVGAPKTAVFGGVSRARVSSQSWKRPIRAMAADLKPDLFSSRRGHFMAEQIEEALENRKIDPNEAREAAQSVAEFLGDHDTKYKKGHKTKVALFFSSAEIDALANIIAEQLSTTGKVEIRKGILKKAIKSFEPNDLADIAIFGRMVANDHTLMVEGACLFGHALSTHRVSNEIDFFSAVDDMKHAHDEGAGHIGTLEFNSACYYRYVGLNLDLLGDEDHLGHFNENERAEVVRALLKSAILAVPTARKNSMFGFNPPSYVLGLTRQGQPISMINAFEKPICQSSKGYLAPSIETMKAHFEEMHRIYDLNVVCKEEIPDRKLDDFINALVDHPGGRA